MVDSLLEDESRGRPATARVESAAAMLAGNHRSTEVFRFFDLPSELRSKILSFLLVTEATIDLHPEHYLSPSQRLKLFLVSSRMHEESSHAFYSRHTFRIFPTHGHYFGNRIVPLIARLPPKYRMLLTSLELRLGPGWSVTPKFWRVHDGLGLEEMQNVRVLKVFIEVDPSQDIFNGFRAGKNFYTDFARQLLQSVMHRLPMLQTIEFEGWPSVKTRGGTLVDALVQLVTYSGLEVRLLNDFETLEEI
ncbi:MAG: hypothetical protein Q9163_005399 [Psora crenata]